MFTPFEFMPSGIYQQFIDHDDVYGGTTKLQSTVTLEQRDFVNVDDLPLLVASCSAGGVVLVQQERAFATNATIRVGSVLFGRKMALCCTSADGDDAASAKRSVAPELDDNGADMLLRFCAKRVTAHRRVDATTLAVSFETLDITSVINDVHVVFSHMPGNRTEDEARAEMKKRQHFVDLDKSLRVTAFNFNYDAGRNGPRSVISLSRLFSFAATCVECYR